MDSYTGPATLRQGEREVAVECAYAVERDGRSGLLSWRGVLTGSPVELDAGESR